MNDDKAMPQSSTNQPNSPKRRVVIAGGSGFIGLNLARHMASRHWDVTVLSRSTPPPGPWNHSRWDGRSLGDWATQLEGAAALVNLAGRSVDCIKTPDHCDEIVRSRVESTLVLGAAVRKVDSPPPVWVQMSTAHRYGDPPQAICDEDSAFGYGLAPFVAQQWEEAFAEAAPAGMRKVVLRTSFVLGRRGGALKRLAFLVRIGLGGRVGHGRQGISWIHQRDMSRLLHWAVVSDRARGSYLATAPHPVSNRQFMQELRRAMKMPFGIPSPAWLTRLGAALLMQTDPEMALYGRYCISRRLPEDGFRFDFPDLRSALEDLFRTSRTSQTAWGPS